MSIKLSYSAVEKYKFCPALYRYHYIDRLRPIKSGSPLHFGSSLDEAFGRLKLEKKKKLTKKEKEMMKKSAEQTFIDYWEKVKYDENTTYNKSDFIVKKKKDKETKEYVEFTLDLQIMEFQQDFEEFDPEVTDHHQFIKECFIILEQKQTLSEEDQKLYNFIAWHSLLQKGLMLVEAYQRDVMPQIHEVFEIQKKISLKDEDGNSIIGFIDAIVSFVDNPDTKVVLDDKTSSKPYAEDSVSISPQLATYTEAELLEYGAYAVAEKDIRLRDPRARTQLIVDKVLEEVVEKTFDEYDQVLEGIQNKEFDKNYDSGCFNFGQICSYYSYCRSNCKDRSGLKKV